MLQNPYNLISPLKVDILSTLLSICGIDVTFDSLSMHSECCQYHKVMKYDGICKSTSENIIEGRFCYKIQPTWFVLWMLISYLCHLVFVVSISHLIHFQCIFTVINKWNHRWDLQKCFWKYNRGRVFVTKSIQPDQSSENWYPNYIL